ncbi:DUF2723 domain-containing protein [bacterium]|nr:DUF2723 domain-containing protein [bacterium]
MTASDSADAEMPIDRTALAAAVAVFAAALGVYLEAICPTIHLGDSGEYATAFATLSLSHSPSYPTFTHLGHAVALFPFGSHAFRANLATALGAAGAAAFVFLVVRRLTRRVEAGIAVALAFAFGATFFDQAAKVRAYPLLPIFLALLLLTALAWRDTGDRRWLFLTALAGGVGLAHHQLILPIGLAPAVLIVSRARMLTLRDTALAGLFLVAGASLFAFLPLRAMAEPVLNWGDPENFSRFLDAMTQRQWAGKMGAGTLAEKLGMTRVILASLATEMSPLVAIGAAFGALVLMRRDRALLGALLFACAATVAIRVNYIGPDEFHQILRYMTALTATCAILAGVGFAALLDQARYRWAIGAALVFVAVIPLWQNREPADLSRHYVGESFAKAALAYPEPRYALAVGGDNNVFPLWYYQRVERYREDVAVLPRVGMNADWVTAALPGWLPDDLAANEAAFAPSRNAAFFARADALRRAGVPLFGLFSASEDPVDHAIVSAWSNAGLIRGCGLGFVWDGRACDPTVWSRLPLSPYVADIPHDHHTRTILDNAHFHLLRRAHDFETSGRFDDAATALRKADAILPEDPRALARLANLYATHGDPERARDAAGELSARFPNDPRVGALIQMIGRTP